MTMVVADNTLRHPDRQLQDIGGKLCGIAADVAREAREATDAIRSVVAHARDIASLASDLEKAANLMEDNIQARAFALARASELVADNEPTVRSLAGSAKDISSIASLIGNIAGKSRLLSLNARIEAARADNVGAVFSVVADEMANLAKKTKDAADDIFGRAATIGANVEGATRLIGAGNDLIATERALLGCIMDTSAQQRATAGSVALLTSQSVAQIDDAATSIGRVASAAAVVSMLARQIERLTASAPAVAGCGTGHGPRVSLDGCGPAMAAE